MIDIEELHKKIENINEYKKIVQELYDFTIKHGKNPRLREIFGKLYHKLSKKPDILVNKITLVKVYRIMINENTIESDPIFWTLIQKRPTRNMSGVNSFAILLSPHPDGQDFSCKHDCYYCPNESIKNGAESDMPRSYLKKEPAVARGFRNEWDAVKQMNDRMSSLLMQGHEVDKLELIIEGGTYTEFPRDYLLNFHRDIFYAANTFLDPVREKYDLAEEIHMNRTTRVRIIGICIETRPDAIDDSWIRFFRNTGTTRIQLGVQHTDNKILKGVNRGHTLEHAVEAIQKLKDNCFKIDIHLMPDLPNSSPQKDIQMLDTVLTTPLLQPDQVKIYPCEVVPWTVIKRWHDSGKYKPYSTKGGRDIIDVVKHATMICPPWVRFPRVMRDIPLTYISGGNEIVNLRQVVDDELKKEGKWSMEIRSREIGRNPEYQSRRKFYKIRKYQGSGATEFFISLESWDSKALFGFLRLRIPSKDPIFSTLKNKGLIRELHIYNNLVPVGLSKKNASQHKGYGQNLVKIAEVVSWLYGLQGTAVISGVGVSEYYRKKMGYFESETFMVKLSMLRLRYFIILFIIWSFGMNYLILKSDV